MARRGEAGQGKARLAILEEYKMAEVKITKPTDIIKREVTLCGTKAIMFDRYPGENKTKLEPGQKLYLQPGPTPQVIGLPAANIMSFLTAHNTNSAPKRLRDKRQYKDIANAALSFCDIDEDFIPLLRDGKPIKFGGFKDDKDELSGAYVNYAVARLDKGIPNPKVRPVVPAPWELTFNLNIYPNREIKEQEIINLLEEGGRAIGLGTWRGVYGKFYIKNWE
jgi:hypothetical protein